MADPIHIILTTSTTYTTTIIADPSTATAAAYAYAFSAYIHNHAHDPFPASPHANSSTTRGPLLDLLSPPWRPSTALFLLSTFLLLYLIHWAQSRMADLEDEVDIAETHQEGFKLAWGVYG